MKNSKISIKIQSPCHENWDQMNDIEKGKHCLACKKNVMDFSTMSDAEIITYIEKNKEQEMCGRFNNSQLERPLMISNPSFNLARYSKVFAGLFALSTATTILANGDDNTKVISQSKNYVKGDILVLKDTITVVDSVYVPIELNAKIIDELTKKPIDLAVVKVGNSEKEFISDSKGFVKFEIPQHEINDKYIFTISRIGYETIVISFSKDDLNHLQTIVLNQIEYKTVGMMIINRNIEDK